MDFWLAQTITSVGVVFIVGLSTTAIVRSVLSSPMRKAKAEVWKQERLGQIRDEQTDERILERLGSLERLVSIQNDEIRKVSEENEFFRRLLSDKVESGK